MQRFQLVLLGVLLSLFSVTVLGGVIHPALRIHMLNAGEGEMINVVARLRDRVDIKALDAELKARKATRQERNFTVVTALQQKAQATQGALLEHLADRSLQGMVRGIQSYWIENMVAFTASVSEILHIADRDDIEVVFLEPEVFFDDPIDPMPSTESVNSSEVGLRAINAHRLWQIGIAGQGRLVMNIDTGVNGNHAALSSRWRGTVPGVQPNHAWYNGAGGTFPADSDNPGHGTHVMGTMTGMNPANNDTLGVAPGAHWIAGTGNYVGAFQWAVNPDGNINTFTDVPDVINCSWFTTGDLCSGGLVYWSLVDNVEAAGAVVIWSAGNCGPGGSAGSCTGGATPGSYRTITPPKNRVTTDVNVFAVGAVNGASPGLPIASFSSRGPSACDTTQIKPEVVAPGVNVRSTYANGGYGTLSGTSMAAPHVAGAVALLRQLTPDADAHEIKYTLLYTARDLGPVGEDNAYGMGVIDVLAAAEELSRFSLLGVVSSASSFSPIEGATVEIVETKQERTTGSDGAYQLKVLKGTVNVRVSKFGYRDTTIAIVLTAYVPETLNVLLNTASVVPISGRVADSLSGAGVAATLHLYAATDPEPGPTYTTTSSASGLFATQGLPGMYTIEILTPAPFPDVVTLSNIEVTDEGASLDVRLSQAGVLLVQDAPGAPFDTMYRRSLDRLGLVVRVFSNADSSSSALGSVLSSFAEAPVLIWYTGNDSADALTQSERLTIVNHLSAGGNAIISGQNIAEYTSSGDILLAQRLGIQHTGNSPSAFLRGFAGDVIGNAVNYLFSGGAGNQNSKDIVTIIGGSIGIPVKTLFYGAPADSANLAGVRITGPDQSWGVAYFAFGLEGLPPARIDTFLLRSVRFFNQLVVSVAEQGGATVPINYVLEQNYPNPFNPGTTLSFGIQHSTFVVLKVYNLLGQEVRTLVNERKEPGVHRVEFNAEGLPGGVYISRIQAGGFAASRKMVLLK